MDSYIDSFLIITCVDGSGLINYKNDTVVVIFYKTFGYENLYWEKLKNNS